MSTLELEHLKHTSSSTNNLSVHSDGSLTLGNVGIGTTSPQTTLDTGYTRVYNSGAATSPASGKGLEIHYVTSGRAQGEGAYLISYDRDNSAYKQFTVDANSINLSTGGANRMIIDASGYVTTPNQPAWHGTHTDNYATTFNGGTAFNMVQSTEKYNIGNHFNYSTERFTAPVAGYYLVFGWDIRESGREATGVGLGVYKNGFGGSDRVVNSYHQNQRGYAFSSVISLAANDWISFGVTEGGGVAGLFYGSSSYSGYGIRLIG